MNVVSESCYEDIRATPLMNVVGESCYEDVRATPLNRVNILGRISKIFVANNNEQTITGLRPL